MHALTPSLTWHDALANSAAAGSYAKLPKGAHFAAWEQPEFFSKEIRAAFRPLR